MSFRDDHDALLARAEALERERERLVEAVTTAQQARDRATLDNERTQRDNRVLRATADPVARRRERWLVAVIALIVGGGVMIPMIGAYRSCAARPTKKAASSPIDAAIDAATDARDIGTVPARVDQVNAGRFWPEGGWSARLYFTITRLRELPPDTATVAKLTCELGTERRVDYQTITLPGPPIAIGEGGMVYADHFMWNPIVPEPTRCEALVYVQVVGARPDVVDHEVGRFCLTIVGPPVRQRITAVAGACGPAEAPPTTPRSASRQD